MMSIEEARKLIDNQAELSDEEVAELIESLYGYAQLGFEVWWFRRTGEHWPPDFL